MRNLLLATDSYKQSHFRQYPPGLEYLTSYIEARKTPGIDDLLGVQFVGLQAFLLEYLDRPITLRDISEAKDVCTAHGVPFNEAGWVHILREHDGFLPLVIQALPEGMVVPHGVPLVQVRNTDAKCAWLVSFIETALLRAIWYPSTVATTSFSAKLAIHKSMLDTCDTLDGLPFKLHDFGARGVSSSGSAMLGGLAHLVNFQGTDTMEALVAAREFYFANMPGFSLPASEHSTMTSWGRDGEEAAYENMIDQFADGLFSIVSDSYDLFNAVETIFGKNLKDKILQMKGKLIVRPDSGDPIDTPITVLEKLWDIFGGTVNSKGFKVLHPKLGIIQGDGMDIDTIWDFCDALKAKGFSMDNVAFGMGGGLLQAHTRDEHRFAMKTNAVMFAGESAWRDVQKNPATDPSKASKAGRQAVVYYDGPGELVAVREDSLPIEHELVGENMLKTVWRDGRMLETLTFDTLRANADASLKNASAKMAAYFDQMDAPTLAAAE